MSVVTELPELPGVFPDSTISEMVDVWVRLVLSGPPKDRLAADKRAQELYVGLGSITQSMVDREGIDLGPDGRRSRRHRVLDIIGLDPQAVAEQIEGDAWPEGRAGIARTVSILVEGAREVVKRAAATEQRILITTSRARGIRTAKASRTSGRTSTTGPGPNRRSKEEFPLESYCAVYEWIDDWSRIAKDRKLRAIARSASSSLHAVGAVVLATMRSMQTDAKREKHL